MAHTDLRAQVRQQYDAAKAAHLEVTGATTQMLMDADAAEERGEHYTADLTRRAAAEMQTDANRKYRPLSN